MLFSDIESSTLTLIRLGARWGDALTAQRRILRSAFEAHEGYEIGTEGDSFFVVFASAHQALLAAVEGQRQLRKHAWPEDVSLRVRMGIHTGEPQRHEDGYIGIDVHRAARIAATASGGQIVLSEATRLLVSALSPDVTWRDLGWHRLKDLSEPEHLHDAVAAGLLSDFAPLRSLGTPANLPPSATVMVGRHDEVADLCAEFERPDVRLVNLTGPGGTGKTRLALAVAAGLEDHFPTGIFFVGLHSADRAQLMWAAIADAVGATGNADQLPGDRTLDFLRDRRALLLLDNLEQISDADVVVSQLLNGAPKVRILATSRRPLHLVGEHEYPVPPLKVPADQGVDRSDAERAEAVELFVRRARMVQPRFSLTDANTKDVVELCRRLDGLPLAIELAAARSRLLSPRALLSRIDEKLGVGVTASDRTERQRTLGTTVAWSYDLLDEPDRKVFRRLGVFSSGTDLAAVESVVGTDDADPLDVVAHLVDVSLLQIAEAPDGEPIVSMLQTIRSFACDRLDGSEEGDEIRLRHARWCLEVATQISDTLHGPTQMSALDRMDIVQEDIRAALNWCLRPASDGSREHIDVGYGLLAPMNTYWHRFGYLAEGRGWHERAIAIADGEDSVGLVHALHGMAVLGLQQNDVSNVTPALERALEMARRLGDRELEARESNSLGVARREAGDTAGARKLIEHSIAVSRQIGDPEREATALSNMVMILLDSGDYAAAVDAARRAVAADVALNDPWGVGINETNMTMALLRAEGPEQAFRHLIDTARRTVALADPELSIAVVEVLAATLAELGDTERAALLVGTADAHRTHSGMPRSRPDQLHFDQSIRLARTALSSEVWNLAYSRGGQLSLEEATTEALATRIEGSGAGRPRGKKQSIG